MLDAFKVAPERVGHALTMDYRDRSTVVAIREGRSTVVAEALRVGEVGWGVTLRFVADGEVQPVVGDSVLFRDLPTRTAAEMAAVGLVAGRVWERTGRCDCGKGEYCPQYGWAFNRPAEEA